MNLYCCHSQPELVLLAKVKCSMNHAQRLLLKLIDACPDSASPSLVPFGRGLLSLTYCWFSPLTIFSLRWPFQASGAVRTQRLGTTACPAPTLPAPLPIGGFGRHMVGWEILASLKAILGELMDRRQLLMPLGAALGNFLSLDKQGLSSHP